MISKSHLIIVGNRLENGLDKEGFVTGFTSFNRIAEDEESDDDAEVLDKLNYKLCNGHSK